MEERGGGTHVLQQDQTALEQRWGGRVVGKEYELLRCAKLGSHHALFEGVSRMSNAQVAIKLPRCEPLPIAPQSDLSRERLALEELEGHPCAPECFAHAYMDGTPLLIMVLIKGDSLADQLKFHGPLTRDALFELLVPVLDLIDQLHARSFAYLNLRPSNILMTDRGPCMVDFGRTRHLREPVTRQQLAPRELLAHDIGRIADLITATLGASSPRGPLPVRFACGEVVSPMLTALIRRCAHPHLGERPDIRELRLKLLQIQQRSTRPSTGAQPTPLALAPWDTQEAATRVGLKPLSSTEAAASALRPDDSIELLRQTQEPTHPSHTVPALNAVNRAKLRERFARHMHLPDEHD